MFARAEQAYRCDVRYIFVKQLYCQTLLEFRLLNCPQNNWLLVLVPMAHLIKTTYTRPEMLNPEAISRKNPGSYAIRTTRMLKRPRGNSSRNSPSISPSSLVIILLLCPPCTFSSSSVLGFGFVMPFVTLTQFRKWRRSLRERRRT